MRRWMANIHGEEKLRHRILCTDRGSRNRSEMSGEHVV